MTQRLDYTRVFNLSLAVYIRLHIVVGNVFIQLLMLLAAGGIMYSACTRGYCVRLYVCESGRASVCPFSPHLSLLITITRYHVYIILMRFSKSGIDGRRNLVHSMATESLMDLGLVGGLA